MYLNITASETASNKGSSIDLVHYLDKENRLDKEQKPELWFNQDSQKIPSYDVRNQIDDNTAKLGKKDAKFFLLNISPSQKEIKHLKELFGDRGTKEQLKAYAQTVMDEYARNFKRPGIESAKDLVWFAKLENYRYYSYKDPEVKQGLKRRGERKEGENMHVQIIISRKDATNTIKLSPLNNSRGSNAKHSIKVGQFDRSAFKESGELLFDRRFGFERGLAETFKFANIQKKGGLEKRISFQPEMEKHQPKSEKIEMLQAGKTLSQSGKEGSALLNILIESDQLQIEVDTQKSKRKKKKKRLLSL